MARRSTRSATDRRYVRHGVTWTSAAGAAVVIVVALTGLGLFARRFQAEYPVSASVVEHRTVATDAGCSWEFDLEFGNESDRDLRLLSAEIDGEPDSRRTVRGVFEPGESIVRTYSHSGTGCDEPPPPQILVRYGPTLASSERSVVIQVNPGADNDG